MEIIFEKNIRAMLFENFNDFLQIYDSAYKLHSFQKNYELLQILEKVLREFFDKEIEFTSTIERYIELRQNIADVCCVHNKHVAVSTSDIFNKVFGEYVLNKKISL